MALKRIIHLTEGPLDFVRGAVNQVVPAVRNVAQAGQQASTSADLVKAVTALIRLLQAEAQQNAKVPTQQPTQQQPTGQQMTFASYLYNVDGDRLDEGVWDAIKSGASAIARGIGGAARASIDPDGPVVQALHKKFANDPWLTNAAKAAAAHRKPLASLQQQQQQAAQQIVKALQRTQNPQQALRKVLKQLAGRSKLAIQIFTMIFPKTAAPQPTQPPASQPAPARQQPARTYGPGNRRPRPTGGQP